MNNQKLAEIQERYDKAMPWLGGGEVLVVLYSYIPALITEVDRLEVEASREHENWQVAEGERWALVKQVESLHELIVYVDSYCSADIRDGIGVAEYKEWREEVDKINK